MPSTKGVFLRDADGSVPVKKWLDDFVARRGAKALIKCKARIKYLRDHGLEARRPYADYLRDGIYELRARHGNVNYRILYFFAAGTAAVVAVGLTKERAVPEGDISLGIERKRLFGSDPERYTYEQQEESE